MSANLYLCTFPITSSIFFFFLYSVFILFMVCFLFFPPSITSSKVKQTSCLTHKKKKKEKENKTLTAILSGLDEQNGLKKNLGHLWQKRISQNVLFVR